MVADMVDEGTGALSAIDVSDAMARIGADYDVDVNPDVTVFTLTTLARFADRGASLLADITTKPSLRESDFDRVRQQRLDRLKQLKDLPPAVAERAFLRLLYAQHPYGHLPIGSDPALRRISLADVAALHGSLFRPSRATLVVSGAGTHEELLRAAAVFGQWQERGSVEVTGPVASAIDPSEVPPPPLAIVPREGAAQSELRIGRVAAARSTPDYAALAVLNTALGGAFVSRINLKLREQKGFTYGARSVFDYRRHPGPFVVQTSVQTSATAEAIADILDEVQGMGGDRPITPVELARAHAALTRGYPRNFETADQIARAVAQIALHGLPDDYFDRFVREVTGVTADAVAEVAKRYLTPGDLQVVVVGDRDRAGTGLESLGLGPVHEYPASFDPSAG
jgi:zinc protease